MAYAVKTQDNLAKWWITGTGSVVNRLSEVMDDAPDGPAIYFLDAANAWTAGGDNTWYVACSTKPDNVSENLSGWGNMTGIADDETPNPDQWSYDTGNNRVYIRLSDDSDPNATDVRCDYDWDGAGAGPAFMTETVADRVYIIHIRFEIGDGSTSTTLISLNESVYFITTAYCYVAVSAVLTLGELSNGVGINGSYWSICSFAVDTFADGSLNLFGSWLHFKGTTYAYIYGNTVINNCKITGESNARPSFVSNPPLSIDELFAFSQYGFNLYKTPILCNRLRVHEASGGIRYNKPSGLLTLTKPIVTASAIEYTSLRGDINVVDPATPVGTVVIDTSGYIIREQYTVNMHITDKDGGAIPDSAVVDCTRANCVTESAKFYRCSTAHTSGTFATDLAAGKWVEVTDATILSAAPAWLTTTAYVSAESEFSVSPTSSAIAEQTITAKIWTGTSELETKYIHTFTISCSGYQTLVMEHIVVTAPIVWHLELQAPGGAGAKVRHIGIGVQI